mgnify:CR=1 FL=1
MSELNQIKPVAEEKVKKSFGQIFSDLSMPILLVLLIIFFTIIKIIQDHYKEKDGGNRWRDVRGIKE